jgi:hypothetical protein
MAVRNSNCTHFLSNTTFDKKTNIFRDLMDVQLTIRNILLLKFYIVKFADLIGAINCSMYEAVAGYSYSRARSAGVSPTSFLAFGSAPASMRALMISSGAPYQAA